MTVLEGIQKSAEFLAGKGVETPRLQAELLLARVLGMPRMQLYLNFERSLTAGETDSLRDFVRRRSRHEPCQHIIGTASFCGIELAVNPRVLIPRQETELLAEFGWKFLSAICPGGATADSRRPMALDFGTGSGCLAIALVLKTPAAEVHAVDISPEALEVAKQNAARHNVESRIRFLQGDGFAPVPEGLRFDLIISNPPYIPTAEIETLEPEVRDYDPRRALDGGPDGLECFRRVASRSQSFLNPEGKLMLEFGEGQAQAVAALFESQNWIVEAIQPDYSQRPRFLIARSGRVVPGASPPGAG